MLKTSKTNKSSIGVTIFLYIVFIAMLIGGIVLLLKNIGVIGGHPGWISIDATITKITGQQGINFTYTYLGKNYTGYLGEYFVGYVVGGTIKILIDPNNPSQYASATVVSNIALWVACVFCLVIGGGGTLLMSVNRIKEINAKKALNLNDKSNSEDLSSIENRLFNGGDYASNNKIISKVNDKTMSKFTFKQVGNKTYDYELYDSDNNLVYSCYKSKGSFMSGVTINFINNITSKSVSHTVSRMTSFSSGYTNANPSHMPFYFYLDKIKVWDLLNHMGIRLESFDLVNYKIFLNNVEIATLNKIPLKKVSLSGRKRKDIEVNCVKDYLDEVFLALFAISYPPLNSYNVR